MSDTDKTINVLTLSLDNIHAVAQNGINRGILFARIAASKGFSAAEINKVGKEDFFQTALAGEIKEEILPDIVENFQDWINLNAVREIIESFYLYIDELLVAFEALSLQQTQKLTWGDYQQVIGNIKKKSVKFNDKFGVLREKHKISIPTDQLQYIAFIEQIRHCASHNRGIVDPRHFTHKGTGNTARLEWLTISLNHVFLDGKKKKLKPGSRLEAGTAIEIKFEKVTKEVLYNSYLKLTIKEVELIGLTMFLITKNITTQASHLMLSYKQVLAVQDVI